ncbi:LysR family transcriptional regulator [Klebsiella oxytoca]|uniref:LysR family transcriptional regulator n=1 Tax=Klebsiella oxytoca TaxID=571 RepID=UPI0010932CA0|nr:LysR family transcriptional regulator [Klebsiella oxytoca]TGN40785.1 LysR family transcriptional regulator [Klebsiella oxytoca]
MARENLNDLMAFVVVARVKSFTKAAALLGISQSALSHTMRTLESRLGMKLLTRTTRSISLTNIGQSMLDDLGPYIDGIQRGLQSLRDLNNIAAGTVRITTSDYAISSVIWPKLDPLLKEYPDIVLELIDDYTLTDIVSNRFDAGTRLGEQISNGMISVRIGPDIRFAVVGSPDYFSRYPLPIHPNELIHHNCINLRFPTHGNLYVWEFEKNREKINVKVTGQLVFSRIYQNIQAAVEGYGLAFVPRDIAEDYIISGKLISVLEDWCPYWDGYHIFYPENTNLSKAFQIVVDALRHHKTP